MKGKGWLIGLLALLLALWLAGCSTDKVKIGICLGREEDSWFTQAVSHTWDPAKYDLVTVFAQSDQARQERQIEELLRDGCDLLVIEPVMADACQQIVTALKEKDIPVIFIGKEPEAQVLSLWEKACYVGCDRALASRLQGQVILETADRGDINDDGVVTYCVINGPEDDLDAQARLLHCTQLLAQQGVELALLECYHTDWSRQSGADRCGVLLSRYGRDVEVLFCAGDALALGAADTLQKNSWKVGEDLYLVGCGAEPEALCLVESGLLTGTVGPDAQALVAQLEQTARLLLTGEKVQDQYYIPYVTVTGAKPQG